MHILLHLEIKNDTKRNEQLLVEQKTAGVTHTETKKWNIHKDLHKNIIDMS